MGSSDQGYDSVRRCLPGLGDRSDHSARVATSNTNIAVRSPSSYADNQPTKLMNCPAKQRWWRLTRHSLPRRRGRHPPARIDREETPRHYPVCGELLILTETISVAQTCESFTYR